MLLLPRGVLLGSGPRTRCGRRGGVAGGCPGVHDLRC